MPEIKVKSLGVSIPDEYRKVKPLPDENPDDIIYGISWDGSLNIMFLDELRRDKSMPFGRPDILIDIIHNTISDFQGLIECESGKTAAGREYIYSIVRTSLAGIREGSDGVNYNLCFQEKIDDRILSVQAICEETGITGAREATVFAFETKKSDKTGDNPLEGWICDPYTPEYTKGLPMNNSEKREYDSLFPGHPLSEARRILDYLINNN